MGIIRKLKEIGQAMDSVTAQEDLALLLKKPDNAQKLNGLVQDIRDVLMDYQVCSLGSPALIVANVCSDLVAKRYLQRGLSADCESHSITAPSFVVTCK